MQQEENSSLQKQKIANVRTCILNDPIIISNSRIM